MELEKYLNNEQIKAALDTEGAVLVTAGAGSGKTRLLTYRIANLIDSGISQYSILAITFTNKAASEMKTRLNNLIPQAKNLWVSTFHSMCAKILRMNANKIGFTSSFTIYDTEDCERICKKICKDLGIIDEKFYKVALEVISDAKGRGHSASTWASLNTICCNKENVVNVFYAYEQYLIDNNAMDFDDLLIKCYELLDSNEDVLNYYQRKFMYVLVDEFQDTNKIQYDLIKLLSGFYGNIFVVGDEDQSIYSWRGADFTNMKRFIHEFNAKVYKLEQNYRSTKNIINAANKLIKNNKSRIEKVLWTDKGSGDPLTINNPVDDINEADYVARKIVSCVKMGAKYSDFAVLMRVNSLSRQIEQRFMAYSIPYKIHGGFRFFDRKEVKDLIAYLRCIVNSYDNTSLERIINFPKRNIGEGSVNQLKAYSKLNGMSLLEVILNIDNNEELPTSLIRKFSNFSMFIKHLINCSTTMTISSFVIEVIEKSGLKEAYDDHTEEGRSRVMNIEQFISYASEFETREGATLETFLQEVALYSEGDSNDGNGVFISSVHSAKGMEFDTVFIIGCEEGMFPLTRTNNEESDSEEERRLMYVAITRAKNKLYISYARQRFMYGTIKYCRISSFLTEIDPSLKPKPVIFTSEDSANDFTFNPKPQPSVFSINAKPVKDEKNTGEFSVGTRVRHKRFGDGVILEITGKSSQPFVKIQFEKGLVMQLSLNHAPLEIL